MRRLGGSCVAGAVLASIVGAAAPARAEPSEADKAAATALFKDAKQLMEQRRIGEACAKFAESQRLDPGGGTLLNLAVCHEVEGKTATAWSEFNEALASAKRDANEQRIDLAEKHIATLEPVLSRLVVTVAAGGDPELQVLRDGTALGRPAWGEAIPVDPGSHVVEARAKGKKPWSTRVVVKERDVARVAVPALEAAPTPPPSPPEGAPAGPSAARIGAFVAGGVGIAGVGVGSTLALLAIGKRSQSNDACRGGCTTAGVELNQQAQSLADGATVAFAVGAAGLATGVVLFVVSRPKSSVAVGASGGPAGATLHVGGAF